MEGSFAGDREEDIIRTKIDQLELEANRLAEENMRINLHCTEDMAKLSDIRREERQLKLVAKALDSQLLANMKMRSKREETIRAYTQRIERLEEKRRNASFQIERRTFPKKEEQSTMLSRSVMRAVNYEQSRDKQKILQESAHGEIKFAKRQQYLETKRLKADMAKAIFDRERQLIEENRKRHLEVLYQERMLQISKETIAHNRIKKTYRRIAQEMDQKSKALESVSKKIETLERVNEEQQSFLQIQKEREWETLIKFRQLAFPADNKSIEHRGSTSRFRSSSKAGKVGEASRVADESRLEERPAKAANPEKPAKADASGPGLVLFTSVEVGRPGPDRLDEARPAPLELQPRPAEEQARPAKKEERPAAMTTSSGSRPFPKSSGEGEAREAAPVPVREAKKVVGGLGDEAFDWGVDGGEQAAKIEVRREGIVLPALAGTGTQPAGEKERVPAKPNLRIVANRS